MAIYEDMRKGKLTSMERIAALKAHKKVGALGASLKVNPDTKVSFTEKDPDEPNTTPIPGKPHGELKEWTTDDPIDKPSMTIKGSDKIKGGSKWSQLDTAGKIGAAGDIAVQALDTIDMLNGGKDEIISMGSGHTYSPKQDYSMYIGQGSGYA